MRVILVPVADRPECGVALEYAFELAARLGANVVGMHIRAHRETRVSTKSLELYVAKAAEAWALDLSARELERRSSRANALFARMAVAHEFNVTKSIRHGGRRHAVWQEKVGSPDRLIPIIGPVSDLLVVSRPRKTGRVARLFLLEAIMDSGRPVLVVPQDRRAPIGHRVLVAWNQSHEAMQAVVASLPILAAAEAVNIAVVGMEDSSGPKAGQLVAYLKAWGVRAEVVRRRDRNVTKALTSVYASTGSDLLVAGAYSRSRLREKIFGGVTEYLLHDADMPVLLHHADR